MSSDTVVAWVLAVITISLVVEMWLLDFALARLN